MLAEGTMDYGSCLFMVLENSFTIGLSQILPENRCFVLLLYALVLVFLVILSTFAHLIGVKVHAVYRVSLLKSFFIIVRSIFDDFGFWV